MVFLRPSRIARAAVLVGLVVAAALPAIVDERRSRSDEGTSCAFSTAKLSCSTGACAVVDRSRPSHRAASSGCGRLSRLREVDGVCLRRSPCPWSTRRQSDSFPASPQAPISSWRPLRSANTRTAASRRTTVGGSDERSPSTCRLSTRTFSGRNNRRPGDQGSHFGALDQAFRRRAIMSLMSLLSATARPIAPDPRRRARHRDDRRQRATAAGGLLAAGGCGRCSCCCGGAACAPAARLAAPVDRRHQRCRSSPAVAVLADRLANTLVPDLLSGRALPHHPWLLRPTRRPFDVRILDGEPGVQLCTRADLGSSTRAPPLGVLDVEGETSALPSSPSERVSAGAAIARRDDQRQRSYQASARRRASLAIRRARGEHSQVDRGRIPGALQSRTGQAVPARSALDSRRVGTKITRNSEFPSPSFISLKNQSDTWTSRRS